MMFHWPVQVDWWVKQSSASPLSRLSEAGPSSPGCEESQSRWRDGDRFRRLSSTCTAAVFPWPSAVAAAASSPGLGVAMSTSPSSSSSSAGGEEVLHRPAPCETLCRMKRTMSDSGNSSKQSPQVNRSCSSLPLLAHSATNTRRRNYSFSSQLPALVPTTERAWM